MNNEISAGKKKPQPKNTFPSISNDQSNLHQTMSNSPIQDSNLTLDKQPISFHPKSLVFNLKNTSQRQFIEVRNITKHPLRLKIIKPKTKHFTLVYDSLTEQNYMLCPGLTKKVQIEYKKQEKPATEELKSKVNAGQLYDSIKLQLQNKSYEINLQAVKEPPSLTYDKLINMKFVDMNKLMRINQKIVNNTCEPVRIKLSKETWDNIHIIPQEMTLKPNSEDTLQFSITPATIGTYHHKILVEANTIAVEPIQIVYTTYDYNYSITDEHGNKMSEVDFGYLYFGSKKTLTMYAVNNTPNTVEMKGKIRIGKNNPLESAFQSPQEFGLECSATLVEIHPKNIRINPFSKEKIILSTLGKITEEHLGKVINFCKSTSATKGIKTHKRITETIQRYKIQDEEFHECFISEFSIVNPKELKDCKKKQKQPTTTLRPTILTNMVLTELKVYYGLPTVKISPADFDFGKIMLGKPTSLPFTMTNESIELSSRISFNKIVGVEIFPKDTVLKPQEKRDFEIYVTPINLGVIDETLRITLQQNYVVECRLKYETINNMSLFKVGAGKQRILHKSLYHETIERKSEAEDNLQIDFNRTLGMLQKSCHNQVYKPKSKPNHSSSLFNIRKNPGKSLAKQRPSHGMKGYASMNATEGFKSFMGGNSLRQDDRLNSSEAYEDLNGMNNGKKKKIDNREIREFEEQCLGTQSVRQQQIALPGTKESLFVTKKIDKYEPYNSGNNTRKLLKSKTSKQFFSNVIKRQPRNRRQAQQIAMQLKGESLKLIKINTKNISFGKMFVGSRMQKQFIIENDTEYSIEVKLRPVNCESQIEKLENQMLTGTDYGEQIIPSHGVANFRICLFAKECGKFQKAITYVINKVHEFQFLVEAEIQLASLNINKNILKMSYLDDLNQMYLKDSFVLKNDGNATTQFAISQLNQHFIIEPSKGIVEPGASLDILLTYKCAVQNQINAGESMSMTSLKQGKTAPSSNPLVSQNFVDERISVDIKNGINMSIRVTFNPNITDPKCIVKESKINFGVSIVSKPKTKSFLLRNLSRTMTLFEIENNECSQFLFFDIMKGKLPPESSKEISVTYKSSIIQQVESSFKIKVRGGLTINVPIIAESVAPNIRLMEESYNFGDVCCGSSQVKAVNVMNDSETVVELLLDLLDKRAHGMEYLFVSFVSQENHALLDEHTGNQKPAGILKKSHENQLHNNTFETQQQVIIDNASLQPQIHKLKIQPKSVYKFYVVFQPKLPGYYEFELPLYLQNFIKNDSLNKVVTCFATEPKFIVEPSLIKFKKKIISEKQSTTFHPLIEFVTLKNPGDKELKWRIDYHNSSSIPLSNVLETNSPIPGTSLKSFNSIVHPSSPNISNNHNGMQPIIALTKAHSQQPDNRFCFEIENKKGTVKPQSWQCINIAFNPFEAGLYCYKLPLLIYNQERGVYQQEAEIRLEGEGQYPTLFFDRKQVIMPVVPLGVESVAMFKLINQGYESISLKHKIEIYDMEGNCVVQGSNYYQNTHTNHSSIPEINVVYPEGVKMGHNKKELYIIVKFVCKKPISFTCKLELFDNTKDCRVYSIPISGTTDSSILTLFTYLSDTDNRYKFVPSTSQPAGYVDKNRKDQPSNYLINLESVDDRNAVDKYHNPYDKANIQQFSMDCEIIRRWINGFLKDEKVGKFPEDIIANPENFLKMLAKMTARKEFETLMAVMSCENQSTGSGQGVQGKEPHQINQQKNHSYFSSTMNNSNNIFSQILAVPAHFSSKLQFYEYLIKLLKSMGCLLNHIRPYFLLGKQQFFAQMQNDGNWKNMSQTYTKNYEVMHVEAWIVLFYQVVNNFWYNTSKLKAALTQGDKMGLMGSGMSSNVYSANEMTVLRWVKGIYERYNEFEDTFGKFVNYGQDFKDSVGLIYAIYHHIINPQKRKKSLEGLTKKPSTSNQITSNIRILYQLIEKIGLVPLIYEEEFSSIKQKEMFLFIYQLYELLPQQLPKSEPIYFTCNLGEKCGKFIQIKNTSSKAVHYWVKLEGSRDFHHEEKEAIKLEPKSVYKFKVNFESRVSEEEVAYLTFLNKLESGQNNITATNTNAVAGCTLVFELRSKIIGRKSVKKLQPIYCPIYESQMVRIPIENQFEDCEFANFEIYLFQEILQNVGLQDTKPKLFALKKHKNPQLSQGSEDEPLLTDKKSSKREPGKSALEKQEELQKHGNNLVNFFVENESIKIKKNGSSYIELIFNPVIYHKVKCYLIFHDPLVGEFQYEIIGISEIPKVLQELKHPPVIYTGVNQTLEVNIPVYNNFMIKANLLMEQKIYTKNGRQKPLKKTDDSPDQFKIQVNMDQKILQYVTFPQEFALKNSKKPSPAQQLSKLKIACMFPVVIKDLALDFLLISNDKTDIRRIKLHLNLASKPIVSELVIKTTARVPVIQPIPIQNITAKDWRVKVTLTEDQESQKLGYLSLKQLERLLSKDFIVKKGCSSNAVTQPPVSSHVLANNSSIIPGAPSQPQLQLVFAPKQACRITGKLQIHNITTNEQLIYHIRASCEQPISQGHINFKIKTQTEEQKKIMIKNPYNEPLTFKVETDIDQVIKVPQFVYIDANDEAFVMVTIEALVPNKSIGYLKLTDEKGRFFWYTLSIESYDDNSVEKVIEMVCETGQVVEKAVDIYNPTNQKQKFQITLPQNCFVTGQPAVEIQPHCTAQTLISFRPTQILNKNTQLKFTNKTVGNIVYKLALKAQEPAKKVIETLSAQVNKSTITTFKVTNSLKNPIKIKCELSTNMYFELQYNQTVQAKSYSQIKLQFKPFEEGKYPCVLKIFGEQIQTKFYEIQGIGLKPFSVQKIEMKTICGNPVLEVIKFRNPNPQKNKQKVQIVLEDKEFTHNCFKVVTEKGEQKRWDTFVSDVVAVPIRFNPIEKGHFQSMLYIKCAHYEWKYMLKGTTNTKSSTDVQEIIEGQCRKQIMKIIKLPIPNYLKKQQNFSPSMFDKVEIECSDPKMTAKYKSWMQIKIQTPLEVEDKSNVNEEEELTLMCKITPLQPVEEIMTFNIYSSKSEGSIRLSHKVKMSIKPSEPEQTISIDVSSLKKYKFEVNLEEIGVVSQKGQALSCQMLKNELVECKFRQQVQQNGRNIIMNSSMKSLTNVKTPIPNSVVEVTFTPNNLIFNSTKGKNNYSDVLMIFTEKSFWSCEIVFKQSTNQKKA